ncbi:DUF397 domain-containing protein [Streptomyces sp. BE147]|uniref:DUF397 domain-containing protein n=1 Tax=Streptomyces sp. BE147 TaxID=3002524 RepID=UPI002E766699|nr:DUF397 domain-containing protein [Streptomyces sp. BE147]MEE1739020.1 DUF397 domain-containing protein [Streptomyces sp. BE147]
MHDDPTELVWRSSSYSSGNGQCVEVAIAPGSIPVRDSKDQGGPILAFDAHTWTVFMAGVKCGSFGNMG